MGDLAVSEKLLRLQALRAVAASLVAVDHAAGACVSAHFLPASLQNSIWILGYLGVNIFFVISGLIMVRTTKNRTEGPSTSTKFAVERLTRLTPLYWLATALISAWYIARGNPFEIKLFLESLFFIPYYSSSLHMVRPLLASGWTLNYEIMFYLIFAVTLFVRESIRVLALLITLSIIVIFGALYNLSYGSAEPFAIKFWSDPIILLFGLGSIIGIIQKNDKKLPIFPFPVILTILIMVALTSLSGALLQLKFPIQLPWLAVFAIVSGACVLLCTAVADMRVTPFSSFMTLLGDSSYATYIFGLIVMILSWQILHILPKSYWSAAFFVILMTIAANAVGVAVHLIIERPLTRWLRIQSFQFFNLFASTAARSTL